MRREQTFQTIQGLQERARELIRDGYVCLVAESQTCDHWIGYWVFLPVGHPKFSKTADSYLLLYDGSIPTDFDPKSIYQKN